MPGAFRLFQLAGITVSLHWSWFLVAVWHTSHTRLYANGFWSLAQYLTLFLIVLLHEFGHALACRQVGGQAQRIVLWPLGGIAFVAPPRRPGALLWSIAAGPLVNVLLAPVLFGLYFATKYFDLDQVAPDFCTYVSMVQTTNLVLLAFNLLPVYPLDGGQMLQAVLWFFLGETRGLLVATAVGLLGALAVLGLAFYGQSVWLGIMAFFILSTCWKGFQRARQLSEPTEPPQFACPACKTAPKPGPAWRCPSCSSPVDVFANSLQCQKCGEFFLSVTCPTCRELSPAGQWRHLETIPGSWR